MKTKLILLSVFAIGAMAHAGQPEPSISGDSCNVVGGTGEVACYATCVGASRTQEYIDSCGVMGQGKTSAQALLVAKALCNQLTFRANVPVVTLAISYSIGPKQVSGVANLPGSFVKDVVEATTENCIR